MRRPLPASGPIDPEREPELPLELPEPAAGAANRTVPAQRRPVVQDVHPLSRSLRRELPRHEHAELTGRTPGGRRCGTCAYAAASGVPGRPKCDAPERRTVLGAEIVQPRYQAAGTACRAWWPACVDHLRRRA